MSWATSHGVLFFAKPSIAREILGGAWTCILLSVCVEWSAVWSPQFPEDPNEIWPDLISRLLKCVRTAGFGVAFGFAVLFIEGIAVCVHCYESPTMC